MFLEAEALQGEALLAFLDGLPNASLRAEVQSLLNAGLGATSVLDGMVSDAAQAESQLQSDSSLQTRVGPYRLLRRLGQGGQGTVFEAVRDDGNFEHRVAIKIVKWEIDSEAARAQFRHERQILAGLQHANIAQLLDGGQTKHGAPYLVMEFIDGQPLTAATQGWTLKRKLELFRKVLEPVAYAHRNLIVHRDLKPSNIFVTSDGIPKLLDFGIAKLLDMDATLTAMRALTPEYASPEQVRGLPISTTSDIYSLGVILYELLTGRKPYRIETASPIEWDRTICQAPPDAPRLSADLDNILLMALRKEPERRYSTVEQFSSDIQGMLEHRPVLARKDTFRYRASKFIYRNALLLGAAAAIFLAITIGAAVAIQQAHKADQRFEQVRRLAHKFIFDFDDQVRKLPGSLAVREMMVGTALDYLDSLSKDARGDPSLQWELAKAYEKVGDVQGSLVEPSMGRLPVALQSYWKAARLQEEISQRGSLDRTQCESIAHLYWHMSAIYRASGLDSESVKTAERALFHARKASDSVAAEALWQLSLSLMRAGEPARALDSAREAQGLLQRTADTDSNFVKTKRQLAGVFRSMGLAEVRMALFEEAVGHFQKAIELGESVQSGNTTEARSLILDYHSMGDVLGAPDRFSLGKTAEAATWYRKGLALAERWSKLDPKNGTARIEIARSAGKLAAALEFAHPAEAIALYRRALQVSETTLPEGPDRELLRAAAYDSLAVPLATLGRINEARKDIAAAIAIEEAGLQQTPENRSVLGELSDVWLDAGRIEEPFNHQVSLKAYRQSLDFANRIAAKAPMDFSAAFRQVRAMQALIAARDPQGADLKQRLLELWLKWNRLQPGSRFIQRQLETATMLTGKASQ